VVKKAEIDVLATISTLCQMQLWGLAIIATMWFKWPTMHYTQMTNKSLWFLARKWC